MDTYLDNVIVRVLAFALPDERNPRLVGDHTSQHRRCRAAGDCRRFDR
jgi:hypothetical protein